jgi:tetratricopeptide (TPR) repeat protein
MERKDYASAEPLLRSALQLRRKLLGNQHTDVAGSLTLLASLLIDTGRYEEARSAAAEARAICLPALGPKHWRTAAAESAEGAALAGLGRMGEAEPLLRAGLAALRADPGALPFFADNAARWNTNFRRTQATTPAATRSTRPT